MELQSPPSLTEDFLMITENKEPIVNQTQYGRNTNIAMLKLQSSQIEIAAKNFLENL